MTEYINEILKFISEINWLISLIGALILSVIANLITPFVKNNFASRSLKRRENRIKDLTNELAKITKYKNEKEELNHITTISIIKFLIYLGIGNALTSFPVVDILTGPIAALFFFMSITIAFSLLNIQHKVYEYQEYEKSIKNQINKLQK